MSLNESPVKHGDVEMVCKKKQLRAYKETSSNRTAYSAPKPALYPSKKDSQTHRVADQLQYDGPENHFIQCKNIQVKFMKRTICIMFQYV